MTEFENNGWFTFEEGMPPIGELVALFLDCRYHLIILSESFRKGYLVAHTKSYHSEDNCIYPTWEFRIPTSNHDMNSWKALGDNLGRL